MKAFMDEDFLLSNETAKRLFHQHAAKMPIYDYHNHLSAQEIYENKQYQDLTEIWLGGDHYKWRQLRTNGIAEHLITGDASPEAKMEAYAKTMPYLLGNPLYHWTHLELQRYFGIYETLGPKNWRDIYNTCNSLLAKPEYRARGLLKQMKVELACTTDDPKDDLRYHLALQAEGYDVKVLPTFRPDAAVHIEKPGFVAYIAALSQVVARELSDIDDLLGALIERLDFFVSAGCVITDHGIDEMLFEKATQAEVNDIYHRVLRYEPITKQEVAKYKGYLLVGLGKAYAQRNLVMQLHLGPMRNNSARRLEALGPDTGFDSINDAPVAQALSNYLNALDQENQLPKTILYTLNPRDNEVLATMCGNFQDGITPGKIQFGTGWWFNDQKDGMERQLEALAQLGMLSRFVGMLTDSRSFLSFPRHEYFRRILCNKIGCLVEAGEYPNDLEILGEIVEHICYYNIKQYLNM
ncbi:MAG: glucuronate isomerase [Erysipelotrichaceae bacterium]